MTIAFCQYGAAIAGQKPDAFAWRWPALAGTIGGVMVRLPPVVKSLSALSGSARSLGGGLLDLLYPPVCAGCGAPIADPGGICASCWGQLRFISAPYCPVLGLPFSHDPGPGALSAEALADPPPFARARSAVLYNARARALVGHLKYRDRPELAMMCARAMAAAGFELLGPDAVLVPVPLHPLRQLRRRYNQSGELARALSQLSGLDVSYKLMRRRRRTKAQVGLDARQRARNVAGAFRIDAQEAARLAGRRIILVDDVITTGATVRALSRVAERAGFDQIDVLSFARVVIGQD